MKITNKACIVAALLVAAACSPGDKAGTSSSATASWTGAPLPVHEITIEVDDKALAAMVQFDDKLRVTTLYYGLPTTQSAAKANARHELEMGKAEVVLDRTAKSVTIRGEGLDPTLLADTADGQVHYKASIHALTQANFLHDILECSTARGTMTQPQVQPGVIRCSLPTP